MAGKARSSSQIKLPSIGKHHNAKVQKLSEESKGKLSMVDLREKTKSFSQISRIKIEERESVGVIPKVKIEGKETINGTITYLMKN